MTRLQLNSLMYSQIIQAEYFVVRREGSYRKGLDCFLSCSL